MLKILILALAIAASSPAFGAQAAQDTANNKVESAKTETAAAKGDAKDAPTATDKSPANVGKNADKNEAKTQSQATAKPEPESYSCKYFEITMPQGWKAIVPPTEQQGNVNAIFAKNTGMPVVSMVIGPNLGANAKTIAEMFSEQFKAPKPPVEKNGQYTFTFPQNGVNAKAFITVYGDEFMVMTIVGSQKEGLDFIKKYVHSEEFAQLLPQ